MAAAVAAAAAVVGVVAGAAGSVVMIGVFFFFSFFLNLRAQTRLAVAVFCAIFCALYLWRKRRMGWRGRTVYLVDYGCCRPPTNMRTPFSCFMEYSKLSGSFDERSLEFQDKILTRSGLSELTVLPSSLHYLPPRINIEEERKECEHVLFEAVEELLRRVEPHVKPEEIGIVITNCSVFSPSPSMSSMIVNRYKLPVDVKSFTLAGMGCSAGILAFDLAARLLRHSSGGGGGYALVLSTENLTRSWYTGNDRSMLVTNCIFRVGGSAVLLSNLPSSRRFSKYCVLHTARTHLAADDSAYRCVFQEEDSRGIVGVSLSKDLMRCAGLALEHNMKLLGPKVLPLKEIFLYYWHRLLFSSSSSTKPNSKNNTPYVPKFKHAFHNICIHAGGKAVIRAIEKALDLPFHLSEPSHMTLYRFGNLSSSSVWYELSYEEAKGRIKKGNRVWQIGLGSGFKCNSAVLKALRTIHSGTISTCWDDCIADMPVPLDFDDAAAAH